VRDSTPGACSRSRPSAVNKSFVIVLRYELFTRRSSK